MNTSGIRLLAIFSIFFGGITLINTGTSFAQVHELGIAAGVMNYRGELAPKLNPSFSRQSIQGFYRFNFNPAWSLKLSLQEGQFAADDSKSQDPLPLTRGLTSNTSIVEFASFIEYNFLDYRSINARQSFTPYFITGLGFFIYSQESKTQNRSEHGTSLALPLGLGMKIELSKRHDFFRHLNLNFEILARKTFTDYLDGIKTRTLPTGQEAGDPHGTDWYYFAGVGLSYTFYGIKCPEGHFKQ